MTTLPGTHPARRTRRYLGITLIFVGIGLLALAGGYYTLVYLAGRNPERLVYQTNLGSQDTSPATLSMTPPSEGLQETPGVLSSPPPEAQDLYPGASMPARVWADPRGTLDLGQSTIPSDFTPIRAMGEAIATGVASPASRLTIPAVQINAAIEELRVVDLQDSSAYETPKHVVGHIPETSNPGTLGNGWYFGHLESPIRGEGNVFARLPDIPGLLKNGEDVYIVTESDNRQFLYLVTETDLIDEDDLRLYDSDDSRITLVACFPRFKYDQRILVTGKLVGFKEIG